MIARVLKNEIHLDEMWKNKKVDRKFLFLMKRIILFISYIYNLAMAINSFNKSHFSIQNKSLLSHNKMRLEDEMDHER